MKNIKGIIIILGPIVAISLVIGMLFAPSPIAKLNFNTCIEQGDGYNAATTLAWVNVIEVYDAQEFYDRCYHVSANKKRANISLSDYSNLEYNTEYYFYVDTNQQELSHKKWISWKAFGNSVFFCCVALFFLVIIPSEKKQC